MTDTELVQQHILCVCLLISPFWGYGYGTDTQRDCKIYQKSMDIQDLYSLIQDGCILLSLR